MPRKITVVEVDSTLLDIQDEKPNEEEPKEEAKDEPIEDKQDDEPIVKEPSEEIKVKKPRVRKPKAESKPIISEHVIVPEVVPEPEPESIKNETKVLHLVRCDKCNRRMTQKTLLYSHEDKCPANKPKIPKLRKSQLKAIEQQQQPQEQEQQETEIEKPMKKYLLAIRKERINQKKEKYKSLIVDAF